LTTFQWARMEDPKESIRKLRLLITILSESNGYDVLLDAKSKAEIGAGYLGPAQRFGNHDIVIKTVVGTRMNWSQPIMARGDRRIGSVIWTAYKQGNTVEAWERALAAHHLDKELYFRERSPERRLPWFFIDNHMSEVSLQRRWQQVQEIISLSRPEETAIYA